ncbi:MAG TPA: SRPBCC family protein [Myxococcota bacterium]
MAEAEYTTTAKLPLETIWSFVEDMDNWARFVTGYQSHEKRSDTHSIWTLKGDVGVLARKLVFQVDITEWSPGKRAAFRLRGVNEAVNGEGVFTLEPATGADAAAAPPPARPALLRFFEAIARGLLRLLGRAPRRAPAELSGGETRMSFRLRLDPGGPMAPMINAMIRPLMLPAAESLANQILAHLEGVHAR